MGIDINELPDEDEGATPIDYDNLPPQFGLRVAPLQPGMYLFKLPNVDVPSLAENVFDDNKVNRCRVGFIDASAIWVLRNGDYEQFRLTIDNIPRNRGEGKQLTSNMDFLLSAVKHPAKGGARKAYLVALQQACDEEAEFNGGTELSAYCNDQNPIFKDGKKSATAKGCGRRYSNDPYISKDGKQTFGIPKDKDDKTQYASRFDCACGGTLSAYANIRVFRPIAGR